MKRVLKRLTGVPVGPVPPGAWLTALAGAVLLLGWATLREPVSALIGVGTGYDSAVGGVVSPGQFASEELRPGGLLVTGVPPDEARHLFELDELALRLRLRALGGGDDAACPDPAPGAPGADDADLRASPRLMDCPRGDGPGAARP